MNQNLAYQEEWREELIDGTIVAMSPRPSWNHVSIAGNLYTIFSNYLRGKPCTPIPGGFDLHLTNRDTFVPDMMVVCDRDKLQQNGVYGSPDLVPPVQRSGIRATRRMPMRPPGSRNIGWSTPPTVQSRSICWRKTAIS